MRLLEAQGNPHTHTFLVLKKRIFFQESYKEAGETKEIKLLENCPRPLKYHLQCVCLLIF